MNIIDHALSRSRVVIGILVFIFIAGTASYITIPKEAGYGEIKEAISPQRRSIE